MNQNTCCQCQSNSRLTNLYGFNFCQLCEAKLKLHSDKTILKNSQLPDESEFLSYEEELVERLAKLERDYIKAKVKLTHILERLSELT